MSSVGCRVSVVHTSASVSSRKLLKKQDESVGVAKKLFMDLRLLCMLLYAVCATLL